jgi:hypothetical protein
VRTPFGDFGEAAVARRSLTVGTWPRLIASRIWQAAYSGPMRFHISRPSEGGEIDGAFRYFFCSAPRSSPLWPSSARRRKTTMACD